MDKIDRILTRGVVNIISSKEELKKILSSGKKLNVYFGIDPTAPKIHLGHTVPLIKLQKFAEMGHNVTLLIGDFTALVGDTSDKDSERPVLTPEGIEENFKTYKKQAEKILDFSKIKVKHNSEWLDKMSSREMIKLIQQFSFGDFGSRELIKKRLREGKRVGMHEGIYPALQGYDSYFLDTDLQIGGTDQTFNMQAGRTLQKLWRNKESFVLTTEFLMGTDGRKMSKSWGNAIWLTDSPNDMYAKILSINDDLILSYFNLATRVSNEEIQKIKDRLGKGENPMNIKKELAKIIISQLYSEKDAEKAKENFERTVQGEKIPDQIPTLEYNKKCGIVDLLVGSKLATSKSDAKRLIEQGGTAINDRVINDSNTLYIPKEGDILRVGKRKFIRIKTSA